MSVLVLAHCSSRVSAIRNAAAAVDQTEQVRCSAPQQVEIVRREVERDT
jgi:hypothetical protein